MDGLTDFLLARIAEDEEVAREATPGPWYWEEPSKDSWPQGDESLMSRGKQDNGYNVSVLYGWGHDASGISGEQADQDHIARWDPARVLAECDAKRRLVTTVTQFDDNYAGERWDAGYESCGRDVLGLLALPYADHPDYRDEWRP